MAVQFNCHLALCMFEVASTLVSVAYLYLASNVRVIVPFEAQTDFGSPKLPRRCHRNESSVDRSRHLFFTGSRRMLPEVFKWSLDPQINRAW